MRPNRIFVRHPPPWGFVNQGKPEIMIVDVQGDAIIDRSDPDAFDIVWGFWCGLMDRPDLWPLYGSTDRFLTKQDFLDRGFEEVRPGEDKLELNGVSALGRITDTLVRGEEVALEEICRPFIQAQPHESRLNTWDLYLIRNGRVWLETVGELDELLRNNGERMGLEAVSSSIDRGRGFDL